MRVVAASLAGVVTTAVAVGVGWFIHGSNLGDVVQYYLLVGLIVGVAASVVISHEALAPGRQAGDYIEQVARRDAQSAAFVDLLLVLLVSSVVLILVTPSHLWWPAYTSTVASLAGMDWQVRQRRLNTKYGS